MIERPRIALSRLIALKIKATAIMGVKLSILIVPHVLLTYYVTIPLYDFFFEDSSNIETSAAEVEKERTVPARIYSTAHDVCGIVAKSTNGTEIKLFTNLDNVPTCDDLARLGKTEIDVTVIENENSINSYKVLRIASRD